jgi:hypothetical protein
MAATSQPDAGQKPEPAPTSWTIPERMLIGIANIRHFY